MKFRALILAKREVLGSTFFAFLFRLLGLVFSFLFLLLIAQNYGPESVGIFALSVSILQLFSTLSKVGTDTFFLRFIAENQNQILIRYIYKKLIITIIIISLFFSYVLFFLSPYISKYIFENLKLIPSLKIVSFSILFFSLLYLHTQGLRGLKKIKEFVFFQFLFPFFLSFVIILFCVKSWICLPHKDTMPIFVFSISIVFSLVLSMVFFHINLKNLSFFPKGNLKLGKNKVNLKYIFSISIPMLFANSINLAMNWTDSIMLGIFSTEQNVGIYNTVSRLVSATSIFLFAVNSIAAPKFVEYYKGGNYENLVKFAKFSTKLSFYLSLPLIIFLFLFGKQTLSIFGESFLVGYLPLVILLIGQIINISSGGVSIFLQMTGFEKFHRNVLFLSLILNIVLNILLIPIYGIIGASLATAITICFWNIIFTIKVKRIIGAWINYFLLWKN